MAINLESVFMQRFSYRCASHSAELAKKSYLASRVRNSRNNGLETHETMFVLDCMYLPFFFHMVLIFIL